MQRKETGHIRTQWHRRLLMNRIEQMQKSMPIVRGKLIFFGTIENETKSTLSLARKGFLYVVNMRFFYCPPML